MRNKAEEGRVLISLALALGIAFALYSFAAQRKVSILANNGKISIVNTSTATVSYDAICYNSSGVSIYATTGASLTTKAQRDFANTPCYSTSGSSYSVPASLSSDGSVVGCYENGWSSNIGSVCPTGTSFCTRAQLNGATLSTYGTSSSYYYIVTDSTSYVNSATIYNDYGTGFSYYATDSQNYLASYHNNPSYRCSDNGSSGPSNCTFSWRGGTHTVACCTVPGGGFIQQLNTCDVTITNPAGHLQSPQFKGGAAF